MMVWFIILLSILAAYLGFRKGFLFMFATLFNLMFAIFISVLSAPMLLAMSPGLETSGYYAGASVRMLLVLIFSVLEGFGWFFFLRDREDYFPKLLDKVGGVGVGGLCGYAFGSAILLCLCIMPCSRGQMDWLCTRDHLQRLSVPGVQNVCNFLGWYSLECFDGNVERAVEQLLSLDDPREEEIIPVILPDEITVPLRSLKAAEPKPASTPESAPKTAPAPAPAPESADGPLSEPASATL
jgi:hypothetical protein